MGATRPASGFLRQRFTNKRVISAVCEPLFGVWAFALMPDARRVAPISACVWCNVCCLRLVVAFSACVWCSVCCLRLVLAFSSNEAFTILQKLYLPSILHLTLTRRNSLIINTLFSVRCYQFYLHATYTTLTLPHGTSTGGGYYGIGEQKSLLLRQISLRPCGVWSTAYDKTNCEAAGCDV